MNKENKQILLIARLDLLFSLLLESILNNRQALLLIECVKISKRNNNNNLLYFNIKLFLIFSSFINANKNITLIKDLKIVTNIVELNFATLIIKIIKIQNTISNKKYNNCSNFINKTILI